MKCIKSHLILNKKDLTEKAGCNDFCWSILVLNTHMFLQAFLYPEIQALLKKKPWITCKFQCDWIVFSVYILHLVCNLLQVCLKSRNITTYAAKMNIKLILLHVYGSNFWWNPFYRNVHMDIFIVRRWLVSLDDSS